MARGHFRGSQTLCLMQMCRMHWTAFTYSLFYKYMSSVRFTPTYRTDLSWAVEKNCSPGGRNSADVSSNGYPRKIKGNDASSLCEEKRSLKSMESHG